MTKCPNCGFECPTEMHFCGYCGSALTQTCAKCQFVNPIQYRFCGMCGSALAPLETAHRGFVPAQPAAPYTPARPAGPLVPSLALAINDTPNTPLSGERRVASVIFADVKGSTELLEQTGTEAWVEIMNNVFQILETEIFRFGGEVGQFRGDGLVAFFGTRLANEDDPERAVHCALAMQNSLKPYAAELSKKDGHELSMRVGVNTGEVIVANVGDAKYNEDTAMGEALTVASRMETSAEPGTILVSDNTYRLARNSFEWQSLGEIPIKGLSHPMQVYRPLAGKKSEEADSDLQDQCFTPGLIGRNKEQQILKDVIEELPAGKGSIVLVTGVKGMGKSFLVNQVRQHFMRQNALLEAAKAMEPVRQAPFDVADKPPEQIRWLRVRSRSYGHLRPYSVWLDLLQEWIQTIPEDQIGEKSALLRAQMEFLRDPAVEKDYPNLATFLSTPIEKTAT